MEPQELPEPAGKSPEKSSSNGQPETHNSPTQEHSANKQTTLEILPNVNPPPVRARKPPPTVPPQSPLPPLPVGFVPAGTRIRLQQPFKILTDIWGVLVGYGFKRELNAYIHTHLRSFLLTHLTNEEIQDWIRELAHRTAQDRAQERFANMPEVVAPPDDPENKGLAQEQDRIVNSVIDNMQYRRRHRHEGLLRGGPNRLFSHLWNQGYELQTLRPTIFPDVMPNFSRWKAEPYFVKFYTYATGEADSQRLFLSASTEGDLSPLITSCFNARNMPKSGTGSPSSGGNKFGKIVSILFEHNPRDLFYLTDSVQKAAEAARAGLTVFVLLREGNRHYEPAELMPEPNGPKWTAIHSLDQLELVPFH